MLMRGGLLSALTRFAPLQTSIDLYLNDVRVAFGHVDTGKIRYWMVPIKL